MFARFRLADGEVNVNTSQVRDFVPGAEEGSTLITYINGDTVTVPVSNRAARNAFSKAMSANAGASEEGA